MIGSRALVVSEASLDKRRAPVLDWIHGLSLRSIQSSVYSSGPQCPSCTSLARRGLNRFFRKESGAVIIFFGDGIPPNRCKADDAY
jgi:hypothetical protein